MLMNLNTSFELGLLIDNVYDIKLFFLSYNDVIMYGIRCWWMFASPYQLSYTDEGPNLNV